MYRDKIKKYSLAAYVSAGICIGCLIALLIVLGLSGWNIWKAEPAWLGFLFLTVAGIFMALTCVFVYLLLVWKERQAVTVICQNCGAFCQNDGEFCPHCGARVQVNE